MGKNVPALIQPKLVPEKFTTELNSHSGYAPKCKDLGAFSIPCTIGDSKFKNYMLDFGYSINVMPTIVYNNLDLGPLQSTSLIIQLAYRSNTHPVGVVEYVLVQVNDLIFPADFYILYMEGETNSNLSKTPIILGRHS